MPERFVVDSSALAKTFLDEPEAAPFRQWLQDRLSAGEPLVCPGLVPYELGEVVRQKRRSSPAEQARIVQNASRLVQLVSHEAIVGEAFRHSSRLSFYDAAFVALAVRIDATLVTYDQALAKVSRGIGIRVLSPGSG